jgi:HEAT repeat protein
VVALAGEPLRESRDLLFAAMGDESWRVRKEAVAALAAAGPLDPETVEAVIELLRSPDNAGLRNSAVESLERLGESAVEPLCRRLDDPDPDLRKFAIDILGSIGSKNALPLLVAALDDADPNVRGAAAENLGKLGDPRALPHLLKVLDGGDVWLKFTVLDALALIGAPVPLDSLVPLLRENLLRRAGYDCLGALGDGDCVQLLLQGLNDKTKNARQAAALALIRVRGRLAAENRHALVDLPLRGLKGSATVMPLVVSLHGADLGTVEALIRLLGLIGDERATLALLDVSGEERLWNACLEAFRGIGAAAHPLLLSHYPSASSAERARTAEIFGDLGVTEGAPLLLESLNDESYELRAACALALGKLAPAGIVRRLVELLEDPAAPVRDAALDSLQRLSGSDPEGVTGLCQELSHSELPSRRRNAALLFCGVRDGERLSLLAKDEDPSVRRAAVASLGRAGVQQAAGVAAMALSDEDPEVRVAAAQALAETGGKDALEPLLLALRDNDPWVQKAALKGLCGLGEKAALPGIKALLDKAEGPVLIAALSALAAIGGADELAPVRAALHHRDEEVVEAAIGILSGFGGEWVEDYRDALLSHPHWLVRRSFVRVLAGQMGKEALPALEAALATESDPLVKGEIGALIGRLG